MARRPPPVATDGLTKRFGQVEAVDGLRLRLRRGEVFGLLGPNGAGKTTTLRLLMGFLRPTGGRALVLGGSPGDPRVRARVGYVPAEPGFDGRYTARDWLAFCASVRGGGTDRTAELAGRLDLDLDRPIGTLSTGNRRKVELVAAFAHRPELLILDEPTSGLDPVLQRTFRELVREETADGATVLLSSHVLHEVEMLADRIGLIRRGRLATVTGIEALRRRARVRFDVAVKGPVRLPALRRVSGVVAAEEAGGVLHVTLEGSPGPLLRALAKLDVQRLTTHEPDLDELLFGADDEDRT